MFKLNEENCVAVRFTLKRSLPHEAIRVKATALPWIPCVNYLDLQFDQCLIW